MLPHYLIIMFFFFSSVFPVSGPVRERGERERDSFLQGESSGDEVTISFNTDRACSVCVCACVPLTSFSLHLFTPY